MSQFREFMVAVLSAVTFLTCCMSEDESVNSQVVVASDFLDCSRQNIAKCLTCPPGTFANQTRTECGCCSSIDRFGQCIGNCDLCEAGYFQDRDGQSTCKPCIIGTVCKQRGCSNCSTCTSGYEARQNNGSVSCLKCRKGHFKSEHNSEICKKCKGGYFANNTGHTECYLCPPGYYCLPGSDEPTRCESFQFCPPGSVLPENCEPPWHHMEGNDCQLSVALIVVICVITVPVVVAVIAIIIYKLYKYCRWHRVSELYAGERAPLLPSSQQRSQQQEPMYTGL